MLKVTNLYLLETKQMTKLRVITCKERIRPRKMTSQDSDGFVYTIAYPEKDKPNRMLVLYGYREDISKPNPSLYFVNPAYIERLEAKAHKHGDRQFDAELAIRSMDTDFKRDTFTSEKVNPDVLRALSVFERACAFKCTIRSGMKKQCIQQFPDHKIALG